MQDQPVYETIVVSLLICVLVCLFACLFGHDPGDVCRRSVHLEAPRTALRGIWWPFRVGVFE